MNGATARLPVRFSQSSFTNNINAALGETIFFLFQGGEAVAQRAGFLLGRRDTTRGPRHSLAAGRKVSLREGIWTKPTRAKPNASSFGTNGYWHSFRHCLADAARAAQGRIHFFACTGRHHRSDG